MWRQPECDGKETEKPVASEEFGFKRGQTNSPYPNRKWTRLTSILLRMRGTAFLKIESSRGKTSPGDLNSRLSRLVHCPLEIRANFTICFNITMNDAQIFIRRIVCFLIPVRYDEQRPSPYKDTGLCSLSRDKAKWSWSIIFQIILWITLLSSIRS